ncbi:MAG: hypothetical protein ACI89X_003033 [Planctomycetota bacterium]|jgi:hypothetical protein
MNPAARGGIVTAIVLVFVALLALSAGVATAPVALPAVVTFDAANGRATAGGSKSMRRQNTDLANEPMPRSEMPRPEGMVPIQLVMRHQFSGGVMHLVGPVRIVAGNRVVLDRQLYNSDLVALQLPGTTTQFSVIAPNHLPYTHQLEAPGPDGWSREEVLLVPTNSLTLLFDGLPAAWSGDIHVDLNSEQGEVGRLWLKRKQGRFQATVPCVCGQSLRWTLRFASGHEMAVMHGVIAALLPGEHRSVALQQEGMRRRQYCLVGPSKDLSRLLRVSTGRVRQPKFRTVAPDQQGRFAMWSTGAEELAIWTRFRRVPLIAIEALNETLLCPEHEIVALGMLDATGEHCTFSVHDGPRQSTGSRQEYHLLLAEELGKPVFLGGKGDVSVPCDVFRPSHHDVVMIEQPEAPPRYELEVIVIGEKPAPEVCKQLNLQVIRGEGWAESLSAAERMVFHPSEEGRLRFIWHSGRFVEEQDVAGVTGDPERVELRWPDVAAWTGEISGTSPLVDRPTMCSVCFGSGQKLACFQLGEDLTFAGLCSSQGFDAQSVFVRTVWGRKIAARVVHVDGGRHHIVLEFARNIREVELQVEYAKAWQVRLHRMEGHPGESYAWPPVHYLSNRERRPVLLQQGEQLAGALFEGDGRANDSPIAWFVVDDRSPTVVVHERGGHECVLVLGPGVGRISLIGPHGQEAPLRQSYDQQQPFTVFMPTGTRGVRVCSDDNISREIPVGTATHIVIE